VAQAEPLIRNISDTALLATVYRARETERQEALFRDPFARRLAGKRGDQIADSIPFSNRNAWAWVTRTYMFDQFIAEQCQQGVAIEALVAARSHVTSAYWLSSSPTNQMRSLGNSPVLSP
jgi:O-methyltransferase involved in polyketide biosynthesis